MSETYTGMCAICYQPFGECRCDWRVERVEQPKNEVADIIHTIQQHCKIAQILLDEGRGDLIPSVLEDIYSFAQDLPEHFIEV